MKQRILRYFLFDISTILIIIVFGAIMGAGRCSFGNTVFKILDVLLGLIVLTSQYVFGLYHLKTPFLKTFIIGTIILIISFLTLMLVGIISRYLSDKYFTAYMLISVLGIFVFNNFLWDRAFIYVMKKNKI